MPAKISLIGKTFGRLKVISDAPVHRYPNGRSGRMVVCRCECGNTATVFNQAVRDGLTRSCGCRKGFRTHGHAPRGHHSKVYEAWLNMKARCYDSKHISYPNYGGRGIIVDPDWINDFPAFYSHVGDPPPGTTLGRIRNEGNYEPGNVRWETRSQQMRNTRSNRIYTVRGITGCIQELADRFGIHFNTAWHRLHVGWAIDDAFTKPVGHGGRPPMANKLKPIK